MINERSGKPKLRLPYPSIERSTPTGGSDQEMLRPKSKMAPRNEPPRGVVVTLSPKRNIVRNGAPRSQVSWRKASLVRCWRMQSENTTAKQVRFSRTRRNCLLPGEPEMPTDRNDNKSKRRPRRYILAQAPYVHAVRRCLRKAPFRHL